MLCQLGQLLGTLERVEVRSGCHPQRVSHGTSSGNSGRLAAPARARGRRPGSAAGLRRSAILAGGGPRPARQRPAAGGVRSRSPVRTACSHKARYWSTFATGGSYVAQVGQLGHHRRQEPVAVGVRCPPGQEVADHVDLVRQARRDRLIQQRGLAGPRPAHQPPVPSAPVAKAAISASSCSRPSSCGIRW